MYAAAQCYKINDESVHMTIGSIIYVVYRIYDLTSSDHQSKATMPKGLRFSYLYRKYGTLIHGFNLVAYLPNHVAIIIIASTRHAGFLLASLLLLIGHWTITQMDKVIISLQAYTLTQLSDPMTI